MVNEFVLVGGKSPQSEAHQQDPSASSLRRKSFRQRK
jgi:hypothetical protein